LLFYNTTVEAAQRLLSTLPASKEGDSATNKDDN
jgi:hypothetical protein